MLIASAAAGVLLAHRAADAPPEQRYVVAMVDLPIGTRVDAADLGTVAAELPDDLSVVPGAQAKDLIGSVTRMPLQAQDLIRPTDVVEPGRLDPPNAVEVALDLPPAHAMSGALRVGDRVQVLSTDPDGGGTTTVAQDVLVAQIGADDDADAIGSSGQVRVRLTLADAATAQAVVDAVVRTEVTLARPSPAALRPQPADERSEP
jgi:Flp pilus assembly protein CpaB